MGKPSFKNGLRDPLGKKSGPRDFAISYNPSHRRRHMKWPSHMVPNTVKEYYSFVNGQTQLKVVQYLATFRGRNSAIT